MEDALAIALGSDAEDDKTETETDSGASQDELDAASAFREAVNGGDDEAIVDTLEALVRLIKRRK